MPLQIGADGCGIGFVHASSDTAAPLFLLVAEQLLDAV